MPDSDNDRYVALLPGVVHLAFFVRTPCWCPAHSCFWPFSAGSFAPIPSWAICSWSMVGTRCSISRGSRSWPWRCRWCRPASHC